MGGKRGGGKGGGGGGGASWRGGRGASSCEIDWKGAAVDEIEGKGRSTAGPGVHEGKTAPSAADSGAVLLGPAPAALFPCSSWLLAGIGRRPNSELDILGEEGVVLAGHASLSISALPFVTRHPVSTEMMMPMALLEGLLERTDELSHARFSLLGE